MFVLDSHCDTPSQIMRLRDLALDNDHSQVDFPKLKRGGVDGAFFAGYTPSSFRTGKEAYEYACRLVDVTIDAVKANPFRSSLALSPDEALSNKSKGLFSVFLGMENGSPIGNDLSRIGEFYDKGIRYMTLCHSADNEICDSCASRAGRWDGLSPFGREVVTEMNRLGMMVDVSHISDKSFYDVLECSKAPVVATHSCCRAIAGHPRNMTDDMIRALAAEGGVIQINFFPVFLDDGFSGVLDRSGLYDRGESIEEEFIADPGDAAKRRKWYGILDELSALDRPSYKRIADHIDHVVGLVGIDYVGIGSDFDGICVTPDGLEDVSMVPVLFEELRVRGYSESDIAKIAGGNFFRVFREVISVASRLQNVSGTPQRL